MDLHDKAEQDYKAGMKYRDLAEKYDVTINTIKSWKQRYDWQRKGAHTEEKRVHTNIKGAPASQQEVHNDEYTSEEKQQLDLDTAEMTAQQKIFADEYVIDFNATQAAIRAGYSPRTAQQQGSDLFLKPVIHDYILTLLAARSRRLGISLDRTLEELAKVGYANPADIIDPQTGAVKPDVSPDDLAAITSIKVKATRSGNGDSVEREVRFGGKIPALQMLHKIQGLTFKEQKDETLDRERLDIERQAIVAKNPSEDPAQEDDGFLDALNTKAAEVWGTTDEAVNAKS